MDAGAVGWLNKYARRHYWRVEKFFELDDLIQEGYYCYYYVRRRYPHVVDPPHIMTLFKLTFMCSLNDLSKGAKPNGAGSGWRPGLETASWLTAACDPDEQPLRERHGGADPDADMMQVIADAPPRLSRLLRLLLSGDGLRGELRRHTDGTRESLNERLCSLIGVSPRDFDLHSDLLNYLRQRTAG